MTIEIDGALGQITELWGEMPSQREQRLLWVWLKYFFPNRPVPLMGRGGPFVEAKAQASLLLDGEIDTELEQLLRRHAESIYRLRAERFLVRMESFEWVNSDSRQLRWLIRNAHNWLGFRIPEAEARFNERDYFICLVDLSLATVLVKQSYLSSLHQTWLRHLKETAYLNWFDGEEDAARCDFAWQTLDSRLGFLMGQEFRKMRGAAGLKCYFDEMHMSEFEKKSHVDHIKKLWTQKKYRAKQERDKVRQRNFVLSDATIRNLDKLAKGLGVSRTEALERLIDRAAKHGMPGVQTRAGAELGPGNF